MPTSLLFDPPPPQVTSLLRKASRPLRHAALDALNAFAARPGASLPLPAVAAAVAEAAALISDSDLQLASLALAFGSAALDVPGAAAAVAEKALPPALVLVQSPLVQARSQPNVPIST